MHGQKRQPEQCNRYLTTGQKCTQKDQIERVYKSIHVAQSIIDHIAHYGKLGVKVLPKAAGVTDQSIHIMAYLPITPCYPEPFTSPKVYVFILKWKQTACRFCRGFGFRDTSVFLCLFSVLMSLIIYCILIIMTQVLRLGGCEHGRLLTSWAVIPSGLLPWYSTLSPFVVFIVLYAFCRVCLVENI